MHTHHTITLAAFALLASSAHAQWTITSLHPSGYQYSTVYGGHKGKLAGRAILATSSNYRAVTWNVQAHTFTDLNPAGSTMSECKDARGSRFGGSYVLTSVRHAALWNSGPAAIDLNPSATLDAFVEGIDEVQEVGYTFSSGSQRAAMWSGSASSYVDMRPPGAGISSLYDVENGTQVGFAYFLGVQRAGLWKNTAASFIDLHPTGATHSVATAIDGSLQGGEIRVGGSRRAAIWHGTPASCVDLHDADWNHSFIAGMGDGYQVGYVYDHDAVSHARLWHATPASRIDLHAVLPSTYSSSRAAAVWVENGTLYIAGTATNTAVNRTEATLWSIPLGCFADFDGTGFVDTDDYDAFVAAFEAGDQSADFDHSGFVDTDDFDAFITAFELGC
jgi:hypothetical protein